MVNDYAFIQILYDFTVHFPNADADGLMNKWQNIGSNINNVLTEEYNTKIYTEWSAGVEQVLALLKILPAKAGRNTKSSVLPFVKAIDKLIVHYEVRFINFLLFYTIQTIIDPINS